MIFISCSQFTQINIECQARVFFWVMFHFFLLCLHPGIAGRCILLMLIRNEIEYAKLHFLKVEKSKYALTDLTKPYIYLTVSSAVFAPKCRRAKISISRLKIISLSGREKGNSLLLNCVMCDHEALSIFNETSADSRDGFFE